jgi:hypothetical protein
LQLLTEMLSPAAFGDHPGAVLPGRIVSDVLAVPACQQCHPVTVFILQETDYRLLQQFRPSGKIKPGRNAPVYTGVTVIRRVLISQLILHQT